MRYSLIGQLRYSFSHDTSRIKSVEEYFDAENLEMAIVIARAMLQSHRIRIERCSNDIENLRAALLKDKIGEVVWRTNLVLEKTRTKIETEVVTPEHFDEEIIIS